VRTLARALGVAAALWALKATAAPVPNPSVETPSADPQLPAGWEHNAWGDVVATFTYPEWDAMDGSRSVRIDVTQSGPTGDAKWWTVPFAPDPGSGQYRVSDWYKASVPSALMVHASDGAGQVNWIGVAKLPPAAGWTQATGAISVPSWATQIRVAHLIQQTGWLKFDLVEAARMVPVAAPFVSITFDDGGRSAYELLFPKMVEMGLRATHFIVTGFADDPKYHQEYLGWPEVRDILRHGHEVGSQTLLNEDMTNVSIDALDRDLMLSKETLEAVGAKIVGLGLPFGAYDMNVLDHAAMVYGYARTMDPGLNLQPFRVERLDAHVVDSTMTVAALGGLVEQARMQDGWLILVFRRSSVEAPLDSYVKPDVFQGMLDYLVSVKADVRPMGEVLGIWKATPIPDDPPPDPADQDPLPTWPRAHDESTGCACALTGPGGEARDWLFVFPAGLAAAAVRRRRR
jgi:MYXO-CTERM domain-containing protein